jgi:TnsA endonuclease N terminal/TnsA endonuclease C terminal
MAKRNRGSSPRVNKRREKEGRGTGRGANYKPWLLIQDVPSIGLATRIKGWKTQRVHHFMSKLERMFFYILEWSSTVIDIREQFPLDLEETTAIAKSLGIPHPTNRKTKELEVMTTDFCITIKESLKQEDQIRTVKYANQLSNPRTIEKLEIERVYYSNRSMSWGLITELDINPIIAKNVEWIHPCRDLHLLNPLTQELVQTIKSYIEPCLHAEKLPLRYFTDACDNHLDLDKGTSLLAIRHLIAIRQFQVEMTIPISPSKNLNLIHIATPAPIRKAASS